ncbi:MAG: cysteine synthase A [Methanomassiliicoccaceae archaeon]|nr:cysteine synthase A [Methanomassiliicoccaceae archaeon]
MLYENILGMIGDTPVVRLNNVVPYGAAEIFLKGENFNPSGSIKDRAAIAMIRDAESKGLLKKGDYIVEPTSGNMGIGISMVAAVLGYKSIIIMPDTMSKERIGLMKAYGAEVIITDGADGIAGAVRKAEKIVAAGNGFMPQQFRNSANVIAHMNGTANEILADIPDVNAVVASIGTGGTITGVGRGMRNLSPGVKVIGVEPFESPLLTKGVTGDHKIQGIGTNFVPEILDLGYVDEIVTIKSDDAMKMTKLLAKEEGLLVGISTGAAVAASVEIAVRYGKGKKVVVVAADNGERYMSTGVFD